MIVKSTNGSPIREEGGVGCTVTRP